MTYSSLQAGKTLCVISGNSLSNMKMQKILYLAHMFHLGLDEDNPKPLIKEKFQAWEFGPVEPTLYHYVKSFGSKNIPAAAFYLNKSIPADTTEYAMLAETYKKLENKTAIELVRITHWSEGAWADVYEEGIRNNEIPTDKILKELNARKTTKQ